MRQELCFVGMELNRVPAGTRRGSAGTASVSGGIMRATGEYVRSIGGKSRAAGRNCRGSGGTSLRFMLRRGFWGPGSQECARWLSALLGCMTNFPLGFTRARWIRLEGRGVDLFQPEVVFQDGTKLQVIFVLVGTPHPCK